MLHICIRLHKNRRRTKHDKDIEKIAVVGEPRWRDEMLIFLFVDYRQAEVQFFAETDLEPARAWLMS